MRLLQSTPVHNLILLSLRECSLGKYLNQRSANTAFRLSMTYQSLNERYKAKCIMSIKTMRIKKTAELQKRSSPV